MFAYIFFQFNALGSYLDIVRLEQPFQALKVLHLQPIWILSILFWSLIQLIWKGFKIKDLISFPLPIVLNKLALNKLVLDKLVSDKSALNKSALQPFKCFDVNHKLCFF